VGGTASGQYSRSFGGTALGNYSLSSGYNSTAGGLYSMALGYTVSATAENAIAIGASRYLSSWSYTEATAKNSIALGSETKASGAQSVSVGWQSVASGFSSLAFGAGAKAKTDYVTALGFNNVGLGTPGTGWIGTEPLLEIGNGGLGPSNAMTILKNGNVGIGVTAPTQRLDVFGTVHIDQEEANYDVWIQGGSATWGDARNLAILGEAVNDRLIINYGGEYKNGTYLGGAIYAPDMVSIPYSSGLALHMDGNGKITRYTSSRRFKENITTLEDVEWLSQLRPVQFNYIADSTKTSTIGLIAEEVELVRPELVVYNKDGQADGIKYEQLIAPLLKALQDQEKKIAELEMVNREKISKLESEIELLKKMVESK
jgi:hypothetical protein